MTHNTHFNYSGGSGISGKRQHRIDRDNEFMQVYRNALSLMMDHGVANPRRAAVDFTVTHCSPRYHVSYDRAYVVVGALLRGGTVPVKESLQARMWNEIADRVRYLIDNAGIPLSHALEFVLDNCRASRYFISPDYAYHHINKTWRR